MKPRTIPKIAAWLGCLLLVLVVGSPCYAQPKKARAISPDPNVQDLIRKVTIEFFDGNNLHGPALKKLEEMAENKPAILVSQILYRLVNSKDEKTGLAILVLQGHFNCRWKSETHGALVPLLESEEQEIRREATEWLSMNDGSIRSDSDPVTYYRDRLEHYKKAPPPGLVDYLFDKRPSQAFLLLVSIYERVVILGGGPGRPLVWADHVITTVKWRTETRFLQEGDLDKARKEVAMLSKHEGWYARRYVVEILQRNPEFGTPEMVDRLKKDANPLVSDAARRIK